MASSTRSINKHILKEPSKPELPSLEPAQLAALVDAVADYARALNNINWFATTADDREGRLFLEVIPGASPELEQAQAAVKNLLTGNDLSSMPYLIETFESCIKLCFPSWKKTLKSLSHHKLEDLKSISPPEFKNKVYFFMGRHIADAFCDPIKASQKWSLFLQELSQKTRELVSTQVSENENVDKIVRQQVDALAEVVLGAAAFCLLKTWNDFYVPKAEEGTPEGRISREKQRIINVLLSPLSATFNDSLPFLKQLFLDYSNKKINIPLLSWRIGITTEIDDRFLQYVYKTEDIGHLQQLKLTMKKELDEKFNVKFKDVDDSSYSLVAIASPRPPGARPRAVSTPPIMLGIKPALLLESSVFSNRQASLSETKGESKPEVEGTSNTLGQ